MSLTIGTGHFVSQGAAIRYYMRQGHKDSHNYVRTAILEKSIHIGKPEIKENQKLIIVDEGTRYAIVEDKE